MRLDKWFDDWFEQKMSQDNIILYALTHGGYIEDCAGNVCGDKTPVTFLYRGDKCVSKGVLKWSNEKKMFTILDSSGIFTSVYSTEWFRKRG